MERGEGSEKFPIGSRMPSFSLPVTDGSVADDRSFEGASAILIVFGCNHCPYVIGSEDMLMRIVRRFQAEGLEALMISSNDAAQYPEDGFEKMREKAERMNLPWRYAWDESQDVARSFDAQCTPECYLFNRERMLVYHGAINDSPRDPSNVREEFLSAAIEATIAGKSPQPAFVRPMGCSIKWRF